MVMLVNQAYIFRKYPSVKQEELNAKLNNEN